MLTLIEELYRVAADNPDQVAIRDAEKSINYQSLIHVISLSATWLLAKGLKKGSRVGIHLQNSIEYIAIYYACWKAGLVPVAFNTLAGQREVDFWIGNCDCKLVFSNQLKSVPDGIAQHQVEFLDDQIIIDKNYLHEFIERVEYPTLLIDDVATIIYTSGTTGNPKGITLLHRNISTNIHAIIKSLSITDSDRFLCVLPFFYSFGNSILHTHLVTGATLVLLNKVMYPSEILKKIDHEKCQGFAGVPSLYISLCKKTNFDQYDLSSLRYMTQAGGPLSRDFIDQVHRLLPLVDFVVMYGQTEASSRISYLPPRYLEKKIGSVGIAIEGVRITVVDNNGDECHPGEKGEICVSGENVMHGYWNNPEASSEVLRHGTLYTGDTGYKDEDGFLYIVGRQSEILKISEHRVSPYEIEEVLLQLKGIEECAVIGCNHDQMGQYAKAFVITSLEITENQIKKFCKQYLALYKIPKEIEFVDSLPKTSSGKIKRTHLTC